MIGAIDYLTGSKDMVPHDHPTLVYSDVHGFYYSKSGDRLFVCPNCFELHICMQENFNEEYYFGNFNVWYQTQESFESPDSDLPAAVCHHCLQSSSESYASEVDSTHCEMCLAYMPCNDEQYAHIHNFVDTNYQKHRICNICANKHWKPNLTCICGKLVHEIDMCQIKPNYLLSLTNSNNSNMYQKVRESIGAIANSLSTTDEIYMFITKACKDCAHITGVLKKESEPIFNVEDFHLDHEHPHFFNGMSYGSASSTKELSLVEVYHNVDGVLTPSIMLIVKITNPGYVGYFADSNDVF